MIFSVIFHLYAFPCVTTGFKSDFDHYSNKVELEFSVIDIDVAYIREQAGSMFYSLSNKLIQPLSFSDLNVA